MTAAGFRRILVATDGSEAAMAAVDLAGSLARSSGGSVRVVHVWNLEIHHRHSSGDAAVRIEAERLIGEAVERVRRLGVQAEGQLAHADGRHVGAPIAEVGRQFNPDVLVVGSRGMSDWKSLVQHSASPELMTYLDCPLMIVRPRQPRDLAAGPTRVLMALESKDDIALTVKAAIAAASAAGSRVLVVLVAWSVSKDHEVSYTEAKERMQAIVDAAVQDLFAAGITAEAWLLHPGPGVELVADAAGRWRADMIVLGSSRIGDVGSMMFGSATHDLLHATDVPVLIAQRS